jgi:hypothetical protein
MVILLVVLIIMTAMVILLRPWPFFLTPEQSRALKVRNMTAEFSKWVERNAEARGLKARGITRELTVECPNCGEPSNCFVYPDEVCERCWSANLPPKNPSAQQEHSA